MRVGEERRGVRDGPRVDEDGGVGRDDKTIEGEGLGGAVSDEEGEDGVATQSLLHNSLKAGMGVREE